MYFTKADVDSIPSVKLHVVKLVPVLKAMGVRFVPVAAGAWRYGSAGIRFGRLRID